MSLRNFPQHAPTDQRNQSDDFQLPKHYDFRLSIEKDIEELCSMYEYVTVSDKELVEKRQESLYSLSQGDALESVLKEKRQDYEGMVYWQAVEKMGLEIGEDGENSMPSAKKMLQIENDLDIMSAQSKMRVKDSRYSEISGMMYFFLSNELNFSQVAEAA